MGFVHDQLFDGRKIRALTIVDTLTRLSPAIDVRQSYRGADVVATLERVAIELGLPKTIRLDNGPEFVSKELDLWAFMRGVTLDFSRPGRPTDNARIELFNGKFRTECLNANWFLSLDEARQKWRRDYNDVRPHRSIGDKTPGASSPARQPRPVGRQMKPEFSRSDWSALGADQFNGGGSASAHDIRSRSFKSFSRCACCGQRNDDVLLRRGSPTRYFKGTNNIFQLSSHHPVGVMIYAAGCF